MTLFTIITGLAAIISLFLPFIPDLQKWKTYFFYFSFLCIGMTIGIVAEMSEKAINSFTNDQVIQVILLIVILGVATFVSHMLIKRGQDVLGYIILILVLSTYLPMNLEKMKPKKELVSEQDYLTLSKQYQDKGDYKKSADLLREYKNIVKDVIGESNLKTVERKIDVLDSLQINTIK